MKIQSAIITAGSGSMAGLTLSHNRGGLYLRSRVIPVDPASPAQTDIRSFLTTLVGRWTTVLTQAQRDAWDVYGNNVPIVDTLGASRFLTGQQHYIRSNVPRLQQAETIIDPAPTIFNTGTFTLPSFTITPPTAISVTFNIADAWALEVGALMTFGISPPQNPSINFFKTPYRTAGAIPGSATPTSPAALVSPFVYVTNQKAFAQVRVSRADGRLSSIFRVQALS